MGSTNYIYMCGGGSLNDQSKYISAYMAWQKGEIQVMGDRETSVSFCGTSNIWALYCDKCIGSVNPQAEVTL